MELKDMGSHPEGRWPGFQEEAGRCQETPSSSLSTSFSSLGADNFPGKLNYFEKPFSGPYVQTEWIYIPANYGYDSYVNAHKSFDFSETSQRQPAFRIRSAHTSPTKAIVAAVRERCHFVQRGDKSAYLHYLLIAVTSTSSSFQSKTVSSTATKEHQKEML